MAKYQQRSTFSHRKIAGLAVLLIGLSVGLVAMAKGIDFKRSNAAMPLQVGPCTGDWTKTDCFGVVNPSAAPIRFAYLIDCYDNNYCVDKFAIVTLQPGAHIILGQPNGCAGWQLDLNWSNPDTVQSQGNWQWGAVVEKSPTAVCSCNYTEVNVMPSLQ